MKRKYLKNALELKNALAFIQPTNATLWATSSWLNKYKSQSWHAFFKANIMYVGFF